MSHPVFPFTALVGQEQMKLALVLNAINPKIGGVLIRGEKGTAKSTAVRALAHLLPEIRVTAGCPYNCDLGDACPEEHRQPKGNKRPVQIVELPVGATEDRVIGSLDISQALSEGHVRFKPGLLAAANRGILYVDEVNLLNDHLVDVLLDAAAMGRNYVEREGISFEHPAQFLLVGTMNPEEGDLRPQLLDRFALSVDVQGGLEPADRAEVVRRRIAFESTPEQFAEQWQKQQQRERKRIAAAEKLLPKVNLDDRMLDLITHICAGFQVDGLRADIVMYKTAITLAAYEGRTEVTEDDVRRAAELALPHRRRRQPFQSPETDKEELERAIQEHMSPSPADVGDGSKDDNGEPEDRVYDIGRRFQPKKIGAVKPGKVVQPRSGRRTKLKETGSRGHYVSARRTPDPSSLAFDASLRAAALREAQQTPSPGRRGQGRGSEGKGPLPLAGEGMKRRVRISKDDLHEKVRETKIANLILFAVDASGSMAAMDRMAATKGAILSLLLDAYQKRDQVGLISFRGRTGELLLPPTNSVDLAERQLRQLPTGGRTPLSHALQLGLVTIDRHRTLHQEAVPLFVLISDGRPNVSLSGKDPVQEARELAAEFAGKHIHSVVIDTETAGLRLGLAEALAHDMGAQYYRLDELDAGRVAGAVRQALGRAYQ
ncbi:MAG TPA: magnesium chelatase subunit D family protein [Chloroflexota bacterium]|nr:magnesium chelatase subunit D family protein [Chloroflexota bacterium]